MLSICYLNHDSRPDTGAGRFLTSFLGALEKEIPDLNSEVLTSENILFPNKLKLFFALPAIRRILKQCDIIHALDGWPYGAITVLAAIGLKKKIIITAIGTGAVQPFYDWKRRWLLKWAYRKADQVVAVSNNTKKEILKFIPDLKIEVINHGVDFKKFEDRYARYDRNENNSIAEQLKPYILSVGAWKPRKGFEYSIKAFEEIKKEFPNLNYVIVSNVSEKIKKQFPAITFLSNLTEPELVSLYKNAELFLLLPQDDNKDIEGFGLVFLEAAAAGLPVVATKGTSAEDAVLDGKNGFLVPTGDFYEAAKSVTKLLKDGKLKQNFSQESLKFSKEMSWERAANSYKVIYLTQIHK